MKPADPVDLVIARAARRSAKPSASEEMVGRVLGAGVFDPLTISTAAVIYAFDQEAIEQSWEHLSEHRRQTYYDIAEAVLLHIKNQRRRVA